MSESERSEEKSTHKRIPSISRMKLMDFSVQRFSQHRFQRVPGHDDNVRSTVWFLPNTIAITKYFDHKFEAYTFVGRSTFYTQIQHLMAMNRTHIYTVPQHTDC